MARLPQRPGGDGHGYVPESTVRRHGSTGNPVHRADVWRMIRIEPSRHTSTMAASNELTFEYHSFFLVRNPL